MQRKQKRKKKKVSHSSFTATKKKYANFFCLFLAVISAIQCILFGRQSYIHDRFHAQNGSFHSFVVWLKYVRLWSFLLLFKHILCIRFFFVCVLIVFVLRKITPFASYCVQQREC